MIGLIVLLATLVPGCTSTGPRHSDRVESGPVTVTGDWDDVEASLSAVIGEVEMAILSQTNLPDEQAFELLSVGDEPGFVYARRRPEAGTDLIPITLSCSLGFFGDPLAERALVSAMATRLKDLAGVGARPIR